MLGSTDRVLLASGEFREVSTLNPGAVLQGFAQGRFQRSPLLRVRAAVEARSVALVTRAGRRVLLGADERVLVHQRGRRVWMRACKIPLGAHLVVADSPEDAWGGSLPVITRDVVTCTVHSYQPGHPWHVLEAALPSVIVEGLVCRT